MSDRELLEKAAKAASFPKAEYQDMAGWGEVRYGMSEGIWNGEDYWNPLTDDGDALRLAVKLRLYVRCTANTARVRSQDMPDGVMEPTGSDPYAATRRAIVRAAAAIADQEGKV